MYHLSIPNGREPREHVRDLTKKKKGSMAAVDIEVGGVCKQSVAFIPTKERVKAGF